MISLSSNSVYMLCSPVVLAKGGDNYLAQCMCLCDSLLLSS